MAFYRDSKQRFPNSWVVGTDGRILCQTLPGWPLLMNFHQKLHSRLRVDIFCKPNYSQ